MNKEVNTMNQTEQYPDNLADTLEHYYHNGYKGIPAQWDGEPDYDDREKEELPIVKNTSNLTMLFCELPSVARLLRYGNDMMRDARAPAYKQFVEKKRKAVLDGIPTYSYRLLYLINADIRWGDIRQSVKSDITRTLGSFSGRFFLLCHSAESPIPSPGHCVDTGDLGHRLQRNKINKYRYSPPSHKSLLVAWVAPTAVKKSHLPFIPALWKGWLNKLPVVQKYRRELSWRLLCEWEKITPFLYEQKDTGKRMPSGGEFVTVGGESNWVFPGDYEVCSNCAAELRPGTESEMAIVEQYLSQCRTWAEIFAGILREECEAAGIDFTEIQEEARIWFGGSKVLSERRRDIEVSIRSQGEREEQATQVKSEKYTAAGLVGENKPDVPTEETERKRERDVCAILDLLDVAKTTERDKLYIKLCMETDIEPSGKRHLRKVPTKNGKGEKYITAEDIVEVMWPIMQKHYPAFDTRKHASAKAEWLSKMFGYPTEHLMFGYSTKHFQNVLTDKKKDEQRKRKPTHRL
jgi:hypothetical protein